MMTDQELLELAAKAAGPSIKFYNGAYRDMKRGGYEWNPLDDDGDAFRLQVTAGLQVYGRDIGGSVDDYIFVDEADCGGDPIAATRRAIVLAVALAH